MIKHLWLLDPLALPVISDRKNLTLGVHEPADPVCIDDPFAGTLDLLKFIKCVWAVDSAENLAL